MTRRASQILTSGQSLGMREAALLPKVVVLKGCQLLDGGDDAVVLLRAKFRR